MVKLNGQTKNIVTLRMQLNTAMDTFYLVSDELVAHNSKAKVYKFNSKGKKIWRKPFGGGCSREKLRSILETSDGELIIVGGKSHGNNKYPCTFEFYDDAWIIKVDADNGGKIWEKTYGGRNYEHFEDIVKKSKWWVLCHRNCMQQEKTPLGEAIIAQRICQPFG